MLIPAISNGEWMNHYRELLTEERPEYKVNANTHSCRKRRGQH